MEINDYENNCRFCLDSSENMIDLYNYVWQPTNISLVDFIEKISDLKIMSTRPIHRYPEAALTAALSAIQDGMSVREASRQYNVPGATLQDRISGRIKVGPRKMGPPTVLSTEEELKLANWLKELAKTGFPQKKTDLINTVQKIIQEEKRSTPFTNNGRPGEKWYSGFIRRHPGLVLREPEGLTKSRELNQYINPFRHDVHCGVHIFTLMPNIFS